MSPENGGGDNGFESGVDIDALHQDRLEWGRRVKFETLHSSLRTEVELLEEQGCDCTDIKKKLFLNGSSEDLMKSVTSLGDFTTSFLNTFLGFVSNLGECFKQFSTESDATVVQGSLVLDDRQQPILSMKSISKSPIRLNIYHGIEAIKQKMLISSLPSKQRLQRLSTVKTAITTLKHQLESNDENWMVTKTSFDPSTKEVIVNADGEVIQRNSLAKYDPKATCEKRPDRSARAELNSMLVKHVFEGLIQVQKQLTERLLDSQVLIHMQEKAHKSQTGLPAMTIRITPGSAFQKSRSIQSETMIEHFDLGDGFDARAVIAQIEDHFSFAPGEYALDVEKTVNGEDADGVPAPDNAEPSVFRSKIRGLDIKGTSTPEVKPIDPQEKTEEIENTTEQPDRDDLAEREQIRALEEKARSLEKEYQKLKKELASKNVIISKEFNDSDEETDVPRSKKLEQNNFFLNRLIQFLNKAKLLIKGDFGKAITAEPGQINITAKKFTFAKLEIVIYVEDSESIQDFLRDNEFLTGILREDFKHFIDFPLMHYMGLCFDIDKWEADVITDEIIDHFKTQYLDTMRFWRDLHEEPGDDSLEFSPYIEEIHDHVVPHDPLEEDTLHKTEHAEIIKDIEILRQQYHENVGFLDITWDLELDDTALLESTDTLSLEDLRHIRVLLIQYEYATLRIKEFEEMYYRGDRESEAFSRKAMIRPIGRDTEVIITIEPNELTEQYMKDIYIQECGSAPQYLNSYNSFIKIKYTLINGDEINLKELAEAVQDHFLPEETLIKQRLRHPLAFLKHKRNKKAERSKTEKGTSVLAEGTELESDKESRSKAIKEKLSASVAVAGVFLKGIGGTIGNGTSSGLAYVKELIEGLKNKLTSNKADTSSDDSDTIESTKEPLLKRARTKFSSLYTSVANSIGNGLLKLKPTEETKEALKKKYNATKDKMSTLREYLTGEEASVEAVEAREVLTEMADTIGETRSSVFRKMDASMIRKFADSGEEKVKEVLEKWEEWKKHHKKSGIAIVMGLGLVTGAATAGTSSLAIAATGAAVKSGIVLSTMLPNLLRIRAMRKAGKLKEYREKLKEFKERDEVTTTDESSETTTDSTPSDSGTHKTSINAFIKEMKVKWENYMPPEMRQEAISFGIKLGTFYAAHEIGDWLMSDNTEVAHAASETRSHINTVLSHPTPHLDDATMLHHIHPDSTHITEHVSQSSPHEFINGGDNPVSHVTEGSSGSATVSTHPIAPSSTPGADTTISSHVDGNVSTPAGSSDAVPDSVHASPSEISDTIIQNMDEKVHSVFTQHNISPDQINTLHEHVSSGQTLSQSISSSDINQAVAVKNELLTAVSSDNVMKLTENLDPSDISKEVDKLVGFGGFDILKGVRTLDGIDHLEGVSEAVKNHLKNEIACFHIPSGAAAEFAKLLTGTVK